MTGPEAVSILLGDKAEEGRWEESTYQHKMPHSLASRTASAI